MVISNNQLRVLTYHRVAEIGPEYQGDPQLISATPSGFERQMAYIAKHYHFVSAKEVIAAIEKGTALPKRAVSIGFDDGYNDFKTTALPILKKLGLSAIVFVPTNFPDNQSLYFWWDRLHHSVMNSRRRELTMPPVGKLNLNDDQKRIKSLRKLQKYIKTLPHAEVNCKVEQICDKLAQFQSIKNNVMNWDDLRKLAKNGVEIGSHTKNHSILTQLSEVAVWEESLGSYNDLVREIGDFPPVMSYPNGNISDKIVNTIRSAGFKLGFTTTDGHNDLNSVDPLMLCRTNITLKTTPFLFRLRLMRLFTYFDKWRHNRIRNVGYVR